MSAPGGPAQGSVHRRVGDADVVLRGAALHGGAGQVLPVARTTGTTTLRLPSFPSPTLPQPSMPAWPPSSLTAALTPAFRSHRRATTAPGPRVSLRRTTRGGCSRWRRQCGSCSLRRRRSGRRSSTRARSTLCSRLVTTDQGMLRTKELLDAADIGKLRPRWDGPFTVTACPSPNAYTLALPCRMRCSPTVNVDRLKPFVDRAGASPAPGPVSARDRKGSTRWSCCSTAGRCAVVTRYLVRFAGSHVGG